MARTPFNDVRDVHRGLRRRKPPRCPECGGAPVVYIELWGGFSLEFAADEQGRPSAEGVCDVGSPTSVSARCGTCSRVWRVRGAQQITDIRNRFTDGNT